MHYQKSLEILGKGDVKRGKKLLFAIAEEVEKSGGMSRENFINACDGCYMEDLIKEIQKEIGI